MGDVSQPVLASCLFLSYLFRMPDTATPAPAAPATPVVFVAGAFAGRTATAYGPGPVDGRGQHRTHIHLDGGVGRILVHTANLRVA